MNALDFSRSRLDTMVDMRDRLRVLAERLPLLESQWRRLVICWVHTPWSSVRSKQCCRARGSVRGPSWVFAPVDGEPDDADYRRRLPPNASRPATLVLFVIDRLTWSISALPIPST